MSESVVDILGYRPAEIQGKSCFDYFHPDEIPFARSVHSRGILLDKAAVLHYCRVRARNGTWVSCECCFTVVHDVLVACTTGICHKGEERSVSMYEPHIDEGRDMAPVGYRSSHMGCITNKRARASDGSPSNTTHLLVLIEGSEISHA